jgi:Protein of unknown function (DUF3124)
MPTHLATSTLFPIAFLLAGCQQAPVPRQEGSGYSALKPLADDALEPQRIRQLVYVPVYSSIYWGFDQQTIDLAATLSIRNVSLKQPLVVRSVKYFDSSGREIREYVSKPSGLAPMATADFVIQRRDTAGGPGANFLVEWSSPVDVDEPVIEAVMVGQHGNAGISFASPGRVLPKASAALTPLR